jgi:Putative zinc ribbon domain
MNDHKICDSCGLEIVSGKLDFGTMEDGAPSTMFCELCYRQGKLLTTEMTREQIIEQSTKAYLDRFGWKNSKNAAAEAKNRINFTSRFGHGPRFWLSWKTEVAIVIIIFVALVILKFLFK